MRRLLEPKASPIEDRINALKELHQVGINTYCSIEPKNLVAAARIEPATKSYKATTLFFGMDEVESNIISKRLKRNLYIL